MRIDAANNLNPNILADAANVNPRPTKPAEGAEGAEAALAGEAVSVEKSCAGYIQQAAACGEIDQAAVAAARELLKSGQLDTPDALQRAARSMLDRGL